MNENEINTIEQLLKSGMDSDYIRNYMINDLTFSGSIQDVDDYLGSKKKASPEVALQSTEMAQLSGSELEEGDTPSPSPENSNFEEGLELTPGEIVLGLANPGFLTYSIREKIEDAKRLKEYGSLSKYAEYFKTTQFSGGFNEARSNEISNYVESLVKSAASPILDSVNQNADLQEEIAKIKEKYTVGSTITKVVGDAFIEVEVTPEIRQEALAEARDPYLKEAYENSLKSDLQPKILEMIPEEYREDNDFLQYLTDKVYQEKGIDIDLDGNGRLKEQGALSFMAQKFSQGATGLITDFIDSLDYLVTGGDKSLAKKRSKQAELQNQKTQEISKGISASLASRDWENALLQMGGGLAETVPIIATTAVGAATGYGLAAAGVVGISGAGGGYTEALNDPEYGDSNGGRIGYALASGTGDFIFAAVGNSLFKTASVASQASSLSARQAQLLSGKKWTTDALVAYSKRKGLAIGSEAFEEGATEIMTSTVEALGKGKEINASEMFERALDAAIIGGLAGGLFDGLGSAHGKSRAMSYARANANVSQAVENEKQAEVLRKEAESTEDSAKKRKLNMMADGLVRDAERSRKARKGFYDMLQARHPEAANKIMELDIEIEAMARKMLNDETLSPEAKKAIKKSFEAKVKNRVDLEQSFANESIDLTPDEREFLFTNTHDAYRSTVDDEIRRAEMALLDHVDKEGSESYDPEARAIAEDALQRAKDKKKNFDGLVDSYRKASEAYDSVSVPTEGVDPREVQEALDNVNLAMEAIAEQTGMSIDAFGGNVGMVGDFINIQDEITIRRSGQWLVNSINALDNSSLSNSDLKSILDSDNWAMLTGENPSAVAVGEVSNRRFNARAEEYLKKKGLKYHKIVGRYGAGENSFLVEGMTREQSAEFASLMGQESVAHKDGLVQADGSINLFEPGASYGNSVDEDSDFISAIKDKDGNIISFSFMPSSKFQDTDGNEITPEEYAERTKNNEVNESEIKDRIDQELSEGRAVVDSEETSDSGTEKPSGAIETPTAKDGSPSWRVGENGIETAEQAKFLNKVSKIAKSLGLKVLVYPDEQSALGISNSGNTWGGLWKNGAIHINPKRIALNQLTEKKAGFKRTKTFGETVAEELLHAVVGPTIQRMYSSSPDRLKKITSNIVSVIEKNDPDLYERIEAKTRTYAEFENGSVRNEVEVLEEIIVEFLSAIAADPKSVTISTVGKFQILFNTLLGSLGKDADGIRLKDVASVYNAATSLSNATTEGFEMAATRLSQTESERQSKALVSPASLKPNADGKVKVTMNVPIYRWVRGTKKDIGSERITKEFSDQWHFINWWKKATNNGQDSYHSGFKTEDGESIDVERIKSFKSKQRSSKLLDLNTVKGVGQDIRDMADAAANQGVFSVGVASRIKYKLRSIDARSNQILKESDISDPNYLKELDRVSSYRTFIRGQIERAAKVSGVDFKYEGDDFERASNVLMYKGDKTHLGQRGLDVALALEEATGLSFTTKLPSGGVAIKRSPSVMRMIHAKVISDYVKDQALSPSEALTAIMGEVVNDSDYVKKFFTGGESSKSPDKYYETYTKEANTRVQDMINKGRIPGTVQDNLNRLNFIVALISPQNEADTNIESALEILEASYNIKGKDPSLMVGDEVIDFIRDGKAKNIKIERSKMPYTRGSVASLLEKFDALIRSGQDFQDLNIPKSIKKALVEEVKQNGPFINGAGNTEWSRVMEFLIRPYPGDSKNTRDQVFAQQIFSVKVGSWLLNLSSGLYPDIKNSRGEGMLDIITVDTHALNVTSIYTPEFQDIERKLSESSASLKRALNRHYGSEKYSLASIWSRGGELSGLLSDADSVLDQINKRIEKNLRGEAKGKDVMSKEEVEAAKSRMRSISRAVEVARNHPSSKRASSLFGARSMIKDAAKSLGIPPAVLQQYMFADSRIMRNSLGQMMTNKEGDLSYFDAYTTDHYKTYGSVLLSMNEQSEPTAKDEERASQVLLFPDQSSQPASESPLFRRRSPKEVLGLRDGRRLNDNIVNEALNTDATSKRIISKGSVISDNQKIGVRLNLNVMKNTGVPIQTMHDKTATGEALKYSAAVMVKDAVLNVNQNARRKIVTFQENKFPMASVDGGFLSDNLDQMDFSGVKAFFNPFKHNVFVDASGRPIKSASEATIVGNTVFLRGDIEYYSFDDPILSKGRGETEEERSKRVKRGPKYDKSINRFKAFSERSGFKFADRAELEEAYDNMSVDSKVALDNSEVASNMVDAQERASRQLKIRQTAGKAARRYSGSTRKSIIENPNNYFTPQNLKNLKAGLSETSDAELIDLMSNEGLARLQDRNDDLGVLATSELINRAVARGDLDAIPGLIEEAAAMGTTAGRILRHLRELRSSTPKGLESVIEKEVEKRGNKLSEDQLSRLRDISGNLFRLQAEHEALLRKAIAGEDVDQELNDKAKELKEAERLLDTFANSVIERGWGQIGTMLIQGNLLTPMSQITNVGANMVNAIGKVAVDAIALPVERLINMFGIESPMKRNYSINAYMYGIRKFGTGFVEALDSIVTGQEKDVSEWRIHRGFAPFRSLKSAMGKGDLPLGPDGKASLSQRAKLAVQGTFGIPAEVMFRFLSLGDVPFRRYVEGIELYQAAINQGLEGEALNQFLKHPNKKQRLEAEKEGRKLTYQESTGMSEAAEDAVSFFERMAEKAFDWIPGVDAAAMAKFLIRSNLPYVRTPANILLDTLTYVSPYVAGPRIMNNLKNGEAREASQNFGKVVVGSMVAQTAVLMAKEGLISGALDWTDDEEKNIAYDQFPPNSINVSGLKRFINGESTEKMPDDYFVSYQKLGVMGAIMGAIIKGIDKDDLKNRDYNAFNFPLHALQDSFGVGAFSSIAYMMDQSFLQGMNTLVDVISSADATDFEKNFENWFRTTFQAVSATVLPNTMSAIYRGNREYLPDTRVTKDMSVQERLLVRMAYTIKDRTFGLGDVPIRVNWKGEPIKQTPRGNVGIAYQLFDITKSRQGEADPVSNEIWRLYESTEDLTKAVGTPAYAAKRKLNVPNIRKKHRLAIKRLNKNYTWIDDEAFMDERLYLNTKQMNKLMEASGKERYSEIESLISSIRYNKMDDEEKVEALNDLNGNFNSAIEMKGSKFRNHTLALFDILQEIYDSEREEI